ncbi:MAG: hypothetical protein LBF76_02120, partial [Holosporales bacterium]|nr:hypothetical protein [Holosporales bacterium]
MKRELTSLLLASTCLVAPLLTEAMTEQNWHRIPRASLVPIKPDSSECFQTERDDDIGATKHPLGYKGIYPTTPVIHPNTISSYGH